MVSVDLPADRSAASQARRFVAQTLSNWDVTSEVLDDCQLLVSELVTNAVLHAHSSARVTIDRHKSTIRIAVCDASVARPRLRDYGPEAVTGRGLLLVERLSQRWGVELDGAGKCVWFELDGSDARRVGAANGTS